jgi:hypothetical protein
MHFAEGGGIVGAAAVAASTTAGAAGVANAVAADATAKGKLF